MIEVLVAAAILAVGLCAAAAFIASTMGSTARGEYMTQAATLASEKLEDLNRIPGSDPFVAVASGATVGSLTSDVVNDVTASGVTLPVNYDDEVIYSPSQGAMEESYTGLDANGNLQYTTISLPPTGILAPPVTGSAAPSTTGGIVFKRRWTIEGDPTINGTQVFGVRRVTVLVTLENQAVQPPVQFQMSMVRP